MVAETNDAVTVISKSGKIHYVGIHFFGNMLSMNNTQVTTLVLTSCNSFKEYQKIYGSFINNKKANSSWFRIRI
jgi:hypothetical protein